MLPPRAGFEPATLRLTAGCSAVELSRNNYIIIITPLHPNPLKTKHETPTIHINCNANHFVGRFAILTALVVDIKYIFTCYIFVSFLLHCEQALDLLVPVS